MNMNRDDLVNRLLNIEKHLAGLNAKVDSLSADLHSIRKIIFGNGKLGLLGQVQVTWLILMLAGGAATAVISKLLERVL